MRSIYYLLIIWSVLKAIREDRRLFSFWLSYRLPNGHSPWGRYWQGWLASFAVYYFADPRPYRRSQSLSIIILGATPTTRRGAGRFLILCPIFAFYGFPLTSPLKCARWLWFALVILMLYRPQGLVGGV